MMLKFLVFFIIFIHTVHADAWWFSTESHRSLNGFSKADYSIVKNHSDCNCTGINFNKSLNQIQSSKLKVNQKFVKLFNKFLK